ncbi:TetR/AcrR family transcriptional regulator [Nitriliruptor alkaliphilus]|uniref:TetR/AcrR family transcriptional regulator n=1 Tax=Nitriliruptor alkaliphilus TaxID=427918 RepID=UPI000696D8F9|nr:TetR/AcrR family transcriptional regulator [Nitriliruptor alkaliphilus]
MTTNRPRNRRDEQRERTRQELIDAAAVVFAKHGFHGASVDQVAEAAGYTKGAVYSNFRSKEQLFLELLDRQLDRSVELLERVVDEVAPEDRAAAFAAQAATLPILEGEWFLLEAEFLLYAARNEDPSVRERVAARQQRTRARITDLVQRHLDDLGVGSSVVAEDLARLLMATADGLTQAALVDESARDGGRVFATLIELLLGNLDEGRT